MTAAPSWQIALLLVLLDVVKDDPAQGQVVLVLVLLIVWYSVCPPR